VPIDFGLWRIGGGATRLIPSQLAQESRLEDVIEKDPALVEPDLLIIGRQVPTDFGKRIDLLAIDQDGDLIAIEVKRDRTPREVVAQLLDYGSWISSLTYEAITEIHDEYLQKRGLAGAAFEQSFADAFANNPPEVLNENHRLLVVATELDNATERIITYLSDNYGVPINAAFFRYYVDGESEFLARAWLIDPMKIDRAGARAAIEKKAREPWNGQDYYVSFGEGDTRNWEDAVKYGFVSAGGGEWYIRTLKRLKPGGRIFVHIPSVGYVGVGWVQEEAVPLSEFTVTENGAARPILELPLSAPRADLHIGEPDKEEHLVRVDWIRTLPREEAVWEKGFFANQNTVTKLRNRFTLDKLVEFFDLED
jgi:hypothetical protein